MAIKLKKLSNQVIVITGASSGIGLATARMAARRGARVVLVSRNEEVMAAITQEIEAKGGEAISVVADVGRKEDLERVAETAISRFGGFDTWVNNAGVAIWGRLDAADEIDARRLFDTNFWGTVYGSMIASSHLRDRGGALINIGSVSSERAQPLQGLYAASKHAIKAFTDTLRMELEQDRAPVSVTLVMPAAIGTPFPQHLKNDTGLEPALPAPIYAPEEVARTILHAATHSERDLYVGSAAAMLTSLGRRAPRMMDVAGERWIGPAHVKMAPSRALRSNLHQAGVDGMVRGDHPGRWVRPSLYTRWRLVRPRLSTVALLAVAGITAASLLGPASALLSRRA